MKHGIPMTFLSAASFVLLMNNNGLFATAFQPPWSQKLSVSDIPALYERRGLKALNAIDSPHHYMSSISSPISVRDGASVSFITHREAKEKRADDVCFIHGKALAKGVRDWLLPCADAATTTTPPSASEIELLRDAFGAFYGERDPEKAEVLLSDAITAWERQPPDERAALYRVRADCYMALLKPEEAVKDYDIAIELLDGPNGDLADPAEKPAARLGRGRALRSLGSMTQEQFAKAADDYQISLRLSSRDDWDTDEENENDGAYRNPYAAWEWGMARRGANDYRGAAEAHDLASRAFDNVGDHARAVISALDAGIDLAATTTDIEQIRKVLEDAIQRTTSVEGKDVVILQRVIAKEAEARIALASVLWNANDRLAAEFQLGEACIRLDQLEADFNARDEVTKRTNSEDTTNVQKRLKFSMDDTVVGAGQISCSRFKNERFVAETLLWPSPLQKKLAKLHKLEK